MRDCGRLVSTSGNAEQILRTAATLLSVSAAPALEAPAAPSEDLALVLAALEHGHPRARHSDVLAAARRLAVAPRAPAQEAPAAPAVPESVREALEFYSQNNCVTVHEAEAVQYRKSEDWEFSSYARDNQETHVVSTYRARHALADLLAAAPQAPAAPSVLPSGWVPCILTHDGHHPEEVAYGPQNMMDRLKKWLSRYFEMLAQAAPAAPAVDALAPVQALLDVHAALLDANPYAYFELAYTRQTGWMAWITDKPFHGPVINPDRQVLARGQGDTASEACAAAAQAKEGGESA
jgi:hypothetical protein